MNHHLRVRALNIVDATRYLVLGTVDDAGHPWTSPVYFSARGVGEFFWQSATDSVHSRNLERHPRVSLTVFDSTVAPYHGRAVYAVGQAGPLSGSDLDEALEAYPRAAERLHAASSPEEMTEPSPYRLYRVVADEVWVLCPRPPGQPCPLHGVAADHRALVDLED